MEKMNSKSVHKTKGYYAAYAALFLYLCLVAWVVLLSREPSEETVIKLHSETILYILGHYPNWQYDVTALHPEAMLEGDILNTCLFVPIGFFSEAILMQKKRRSSILWCAIWGLLCSLAIEVIQLITRRGWFDMDDLLMNVLGAFLGGVLYMFIMLIIRLLKIGYAEPEK